MSTSNTKKTRIKGLPPIIQLDQIDNTTGSIHSNTFNDRNTVVFGNEVLINAGYNVAHNNTFLNNTENTSSIYFSGSLKKGVADSFLQYSSGSNPNVKPFKEQFLPEVDGKSNNNEFYLTGSSITNIGEGFSNPVWSKTKLEIDISADSHTRYLGVTQSYGGETSELGFKHPSYLDSRFSPMLYYNFSNKKWESIGLGYNYSKSDALFPPFNEIVSYTQMGAGLYGTIGFNPGLVNLHMINPRNLTSSNPATVLTTSKLLAENLPSKMFEYHKMAGRYTDQWGFPFAPIYYATSSQVYKSANIVDKPFAVEKIVVMMSGVSFTNTPITSSYFNLSGVIAPYTVNTFFILNQRKARTSYKSLFRNVTGSYKPAKFSKVITNQWKSNASSLVYNTINDTSRDLIGYASIVGVTTDFTGTITRTIGTSGSALPFSEGNFNNQYFFFRNKLENPTTETAHAINDLLGPNRQIIYLTSSLSNSLSNLNWSRDLILEIEASSPVPYRNIVSFNDPMAAVESKSLDDMFSDHRLASISNENGGRNGLGAIHPTGRDFVNCYGQPTVNDNDLIVYAKEDNWACKTHYQQINGRSFQKNNPYILMPGDELIFGWQMPFPKSISGAPVNPNGNPSWSASFETTSSQGDTIISYRNHEGETSTAELGILPTALIKFDGDAKVILYGSYIDEGKESHNNDNRILTTNAIQETIIGND